MDQDEKKATPAGADSNSAPVFSPPSRSLLFQDSKEGEKIFNTLPVQKQLSILLQTHGKERLHTLFLAKSPEALVAQLPEVEVFLTVKEVGDKDALPLIVWTTPDQFQLLLDFDLWKKDRLDPEKIRHWVELLLECGEKKIAQFIHSTEPEWIALLLKKCLSVTTLDGEPLEMEGEIQPFTLDHYYFIHFKRKAIREVIEPFLKIFSLIDGDRYRKVMEALVWELESDLEETAYRFRSVRLAEYGFPDFQEALDIYRFVNPESVLPKEMPPPAQTREGEEGARSFFYMTFLGEGPFFSSVLAGINDPPVQDRLKIEMTALCNRALVAEPIDFSSFDQIERVSKKVFHTLNLGLQHLSGQDEKKALALLQHLPLLKVFQYGVSLTVLLRRRAEALFQGPWFGGSEENLFVLDPPYLERFLGMLKRRPTLNRNGREEDFKDLREIKEGKSFLDAMETILRFIGTQLHLSPPSIKTLDLSGHFPEDWREITLSTLYLTGIANQVLQKTFRFEALEKGQLIRFLSEIFTRPPGGKGMIHMEIKNTLKEWIHSMEGDELKREHLLAFQDFCLDLFEEEFGKIPPGEEMDPRFFKGLLTCKPSSV